MWLVTSCLRRKTTDPTPDGKRRKKINARNRVAPFNQIGADVPEKKRRLQKKRPRPYQRGSIGVTQKKLFYFIEEGWHTGCSLLWGGDGRKEVPGPSNSQLCGHDWQKEEDDPPQKKPPCHF